MTFKCAKGLAPSYLNCNYINRSNFHDYATRSRNNLNIPLLKSAVGQRSFKYRSVKIWNGLEESLKGIDNYNTFKKRLKHDLLHRFLDSSNTTYN
jgi:hypothetical protein